VRQTKKVAEGGLFCLFRFLFVQVFVCSGFCLFRFLFVQVFVCSGFCLFRAEFHRDIWTITVEQ